jgi:hypothetical protein
MRTRSAGRRTPAARRSLAISLLLTLLLAFSAVGAEAVGARDSLRVVIEQEGTRWLASRTGAQATSALSADISFTTPVPTTGRVGYGINGTITAWTANLPFAKEHTAHLSGLRPSTTYRVVVTVIGSDGRRGSGETTVRTGPFPSQARSAMQRGALTIDGEPFFPILAFGQCDTFDQSIARGVNLFLLGGCMHEDQAASSAAIAGQGFLATPAGSNVVLPGHIGWVYPDEVDERGGTYETLPALPAWQDTGKVSFLTLTNHFYSKAEALPIGKGMYPGLAKRADVLGFDLYPMQIWCRYEGFDHVYYSQRDLDALVQGRPTYQWIETRPMGCTEKSLVPTAQTIEVETWLAIAGGADGIGWFPWNPDNASVSAAMKHVGDQIAALQPALLAPELPAGASRGKGVFVGARKLNDAIYVIAVNATRAKVTAQILVNGLGNLPLETVFEPKRRITPTGGLFSDSFGPLQTHIYVYAPDGYGTRS